MLSQGNGDALLGKARGSVPMQNNTSQLSVNDEIQNNSPERSQQPNPSQSQMKSGHRKKRKAEATFTHVLKFFNIILGILMVGFGAYCYYGFDEQTSGNKLPLVGYILPGYIGFSGLIILAIQMNIKFICRNMKFLYNYFGRGIFNIYVGIMPLTLINSSNDSQQEVYFQVIIYVIVSLMVFIGLLYIFAKVCCCAKEGDKRKKRRNKSDSSSSEGSQSD